MVYLYWLWRWIYEPKRSALTLNARLHSTCGCVCVLVCVNCVGTQICQKHALCLTTHTFVSPTIGALSVLSQRFVDAIFLTAAFPRVGQAPHKFPSIFHLIFALVYFFIFGNIAKSFSMLLPAEIFDITFAVIVAAIVVVILVVIFHNLTFLGNVCVVNNACYCYAFMGQNGRTYTR